MEESEISNPFDLFVLECGESEPEVRINAIKKLSTIAVALDVEATRTKLIPHLIALTEDIYNDDELLLNLADQLGNFLPFVGGVEHANLLLNILERLASVEEIVVKDKTIQSLKKIGSALDADSLKTTFVPLIFRLAESEWCTTKSTVTSLFAVCYPKLPSEVRTDLRNIYRLLCQDEWPLVRRSAATKLTELVEVLELQPLKDEFIPVFDNLSKDDQDSVRVLAVDVGISIAQRLKKKEVEDFILSTLSDLSGDASWRVRYQVAHQINALQRALGHDLTRKYLLNIYHHLVHDSEPQVREAAARGIVIFCELLQKTFREADHDIKDAIDPAIPEHVFPLIQYLEQDICIEVKEALSKVITTLSPLLGVDQTKGFLWPLITNSLLNDSSKVRENIISNLNSIISVIGIADIADTVLKIVIDLVNSSASVWRTRRNLIVTINYIAKQSGKEYFDDHLKALYQKLLSDGVYAVRKTAPLILPILVKNFGCSWASKSVVPLFLIFSEDKHYLYRFVCLYCIDELIAPTLEAKARGGSKTLLHRVRDENSEKVESFLQGVYTLNEALKKRLQEEWAVNCSGKLEDHEIFEDDIKRYAEDTIEMFVKDNDVDIVSVSKEEIQRGADIYLEGVLDLILNKCLDVVRSLAKDPVPNVQSKVGRTLKAIGRFNQTLDDELQEEWVRNILKIPVKADKEEVVEEEPEDKEAGACVHPVQSSEIKDTSTNTKQNSAEEENIEINSAPAESEMSLETELVEMLEEKLSAEKNTES